MRGREEVVGWEWLEGLERESPAQGHRDNGEWEGMGRALAFESQLPCSMGLTRPCKWKPWGVGRDLSSSGRFKNQTQKPVRGLFANHIRGSFDYGFALCLYALQEDEKSDPSRKGFFLYDE